jgi:glycosyltransferase involved in cell wall biosynthesis
MAKFSILSANYNKLPFIKQSVQSVLAQTHKNWEYIIVDDNSTDGSYEYLQSIQDERIKIIKNVERKYCSSCYSLALKKASGGICGILDSDDTLVPDAISKVMGMYKKHTEIDFIYTQHFWCDAELRKCRTGLSARPREKLSLAHMAKRGIHCFSHWRTFKRVLAEKQELFPDGLKYSVDKSLGFLLEEVGRGGFYPEHLYYYRYYPGNMSKVFAAEQKQTTLKLSKQHLKNRENLGIKVQPIVIVR